MGLERQSGYAYKSWTDKELVLAIAASTHFDDVAILLNLSSQAGVNGRRLRRYADKNSISYIHFVKKPSNIRSSIRSLESVLKENSEYNSGRLKKRLIAAGIKDSNCENCGLAEWMGVPIPTELEHVNGIHNDNRIENLKILCPNCHALTPTWRGRNTSKARSKITPP